jgi:copper oxidase (laccase) domain-containing protein
MAYIGPHIAACHYEVDVTVMSQFVDTFGSRARADSGGLDLEAAVTASLTDAGVAAYNIACLGVCTAEATDRFYSYRAEQGLTGRHSALACILPRE